MEGPATVGILGAKQERETNAMQEKLIGRSGGSVVAGWQVIGHQHPQSAKEITSRDPSAGVG